MTTIPSDKRASGLWMLGRSSHRLRIGNLVAAGAQYAILITGAMIMLFPLLWTVSTSLKDQSKVTLLQLQLIPDPVRWDNYLAIFHQVPLLTYLSNTLAIVLAAEFGGLLVSSLVAYSFARIPFPGRNVFFSLLLSTMMLPYVVRLIPLYAMFDQLGLINTLWPLIIPRLLGHDAFFIFLMRQFFRGIPSELLDAAEVDGCGHIGIWRLMVLPLSKPVLATIGIFAFQGAWIDFIFPLIYLSGAKSRWTMALGLNAMKDPWGPTNVALMMVFAVLMTIPMLVLFFLGQKYIIQGTTMSGLKG
jgi:multiple sugar transport system permease protein